MTRSEVRAKKASMRGLGSALLLGSLVAMSGGCGDPTPPVSALANDGAARASTVGYDLRRLRPRNEESLDAMFERLRKQALAEGKQVAVLFSADWCEPCRRLELELGNMHPPEDIGHMRILELKEEDWEKVTRMNEIDALRKRWDDSKNTYPILVVLDDKGVKVEEMKEAKDRLEAAGQEATLPTWFRGLRAG